ncbi:MAG: hypothetical protein LRZ85_05510 [Alphaproteobacteria bacterium]|nr:hypothetical protein [Alphaproteobacteria bacterium]
MLFLLLSFYKPGLPLAGSAAAISLSTALLLHMVAIGTRMIILERPPVGTLYESVLFVALIAALAGIMAALRLKNKTACRGGVLCGTCLAGCGAVTIPDSSNFDVLGAVLNTNFWLATHVLIITAGYGFCVITALLVSYAADERRQTAL